ncbi:hypothetical protein [Agrobacterium tumefaciens]|uniref:hypothetical protein n=1 Tax=Agrobacterium tumefaciens TaxID=358 RepID=UPI0015744193|nr:hypothetical protein [Agrobacterium tumefaciens]WCJ63816.1 hypothetical protein G6M15_06375 [Agrobacterium tumefaciens]
MADNNKKKPINSVMFNADGSNAAPPEPQIEEMTEEDRKYLISQGLNPDDYIAVKEGTEASLINNSDESFNPYEWQEIDPQSIERELGFTERQRYSGLTKIEDRENALRKDFDNVTRVGDSNFVMTDPKTGELIVYNKEGWLPTGGDFADFIPDAVGSVVSIPTTIIGGAAGSAVAPGPGTVAGGIAGGAAGYSAGAEAARRGLNWLNGVEDTRTTGETASQMGTDLGFAAAGGALGAGAGAAVKGAGKVIGSSLKSRALGGTVDDAAKAAERLTTYETAGVTPTPGMIGGEALSTAELQRAGTKPWLKNKIDTVPEQLKAGWQGSIDDVSRGQGSMTPNEAGGFIRENIGNLKTNVQNETNRLYDNVSGLTNGVPVESTTTRKAYETLAHEFENAGAFKKSTDGSVYERSLGQVKALLDDIEAGKADFEYLKQARTTLNDTGSAMGATRAEKRIYSRVGEAITADMEATAKKAGDDVLKAWQDANGQFMRRLDPTDVIGNKSIDKVLKNQSDDAIFNLISTGSKTNASQATRILEQVHLAGGDDALRSVSTTVLDRIGNNAAGEFSIPALTKNWNNLTPEAKSSLFKFKGGAEIRDRMNAIANAGKQFQEYGNNANRSNTARHIGSAVKGMMDRYAGPVAGAAALSGSPSAAIGYGAFRGAKWMFDRATRRMIEDPKTLSWLAKLPSVADPEKHLLGLKNLYQTTKDERTRLAIREYLEGLNTNNSEQ